MSERFKPSEKTQELLEKTWGSGGGVLQERSLKFLLQLWDCEGDPRRAAAVFAHFYVNQAAIIACLGTMFAGKVPSKELWMSACETAFDESLARIDKADEVFANFVPPRIDE